MITKDFTLLCSGVTLGVYIPALTIYHQIKDKGYNTDIHVLEGLFRNSKQAKLPEVKAAFHKNFSFALMAQKVPEGINESFDSDKLNALLNEWLKEKRKKFLVFSGYWIPIIEQFVESADYTDIEIFICHMDAVESVSWSRFDSDNPIYKHIWMYSNEKKEVLSYLNINESEPVDFNQRNNNILVHGGGWGIGTYQKAIPKLKGKGFKLDVIAYNINDIKNQNPAINYHLLDPDWKPWEKNGNSEYSFPGLAEITSNGSYHEFRNTKKYSAVYNILKNNKAIISKPGGATLIDSISSATPLIFLDPFGDYEAKNAELWVELGFGLPFSEWEEHNFSIKILEKLHNNLINKRQNIDNYINNFHATGNY